MQCCLWGICGVVDGILGHQMRLDQALITANETDTNTALHSNMEAIVWLDYHRQTRAGIVSVKCGSSAVIRRSGESLEELEGRAMARHLNARGGASGGL